MLALLVEVGDGNARGEDGVVLAEGRRVSAGFKRDKRRKRVRGGA